MSVCMHSFNSPVPHMAEEVHFNNDGHFTNADIIAAERNWRVGFLSRWTSHWLRDQIITPLIKNMLHQRVRGSVLGVLPVRVIMSFI